MCTCILYSVTFLKMWSYIQVNYWCRLEERSRFKLNRRRPTSYNRGQSYTCQIKFIVISYYSLVMYIFCPQIY